MVIWSIFGMAAAGIAVIASPTLPVILGFMAFQGLLNGPLDVALFTLRQRRTDPAWLGRAFAVSMSLNFAGYPIGAAIGGALVGINSDLAMATAIAFGFAATIGAVLMLPREKAAAVHPVETAT
jgi:MFS family permease